METRVITIKKTEIMERKIGEVFDFEGKKLKIQETVMGTCIGCIFKDNCNCNDVWKTVGVCSASSRTDKKQVIVVEAEQSPDEEPRKLEGLNLCEKLEYCPEGTHFWSPLLGDVKFMCVGDRMVTVEDKNANSWDINEDSTITIGGVGGVTSEEPMLLPSREQRDWSKVTFKRPIESLPKTWGEFIEEQGGEEPEEIVLHNAVGELLVTDDNFLKSVDRHVAMIKLHALRDCYRQGWEPEYDVDCWSIMSFKDGELRVREFGQISTFLSFGDQETARAFLNRFEDLIKEAGDLI